MVRSARRTALLAWCWPLLLGPLLASCGQDGGALPARLDGSRGVTQGGPQDIGYFRQVVAAGEIPSPETLPEVGFFAEHAIDLPPADCGEAFCLHPMLAVAPRFDGSNWTMAFVGLNSALDPATLPRSPLHLAVVIEHSWRTLGYEGAITAGLEALVRGLLPEDRVSLYVFDTAVRRALDLAPDAGSIGDAQAALVDAAPQETAALYDALADATADLAKHEGARRLVLLSSGVADAGITDPARVIALAEGAARGGIGLSVVGLGADPQGPLLAELGELGAGNVYQATDPADLVDILGVEAATTLVPLAVDFELRLQAAPGYHVGPVYGARRAETRGSSEAVLRSPALFLGHRQGSGDVARGRRGGGGGLFVQLEAVRAEGAPPIAAGSPAATVVASWVDPTSGERREQRQTLVNALEPGENPEQQWPYFSDVARGKVFMMLNLYLLLRSTTELYAAGDCARAKGVLDMVTPTVYRFQTYYDDPDLWADLELISALRGNLERSCAAVAPVEPRASFYGSCFFI